MNWLNGLEQLVGNAAHAVGIGQQPQAQPAQQPAQQQPSPQAFKQLIGQPQPAPQDNGIYTQGPDYSVLAPHALQNLYNGPMPVDSPHGIGGQSNHPIWQLQNATPQQPQLYKI